MRNMEYLTNIYCIQITKDVVKAYNVRGKCLI